MFDRKTDLGTIRLLAMDFDGVHTDGFVHVSDDGRESVRCSRRDSLGLNMLAHIGIKLVVISKEKNEVVKRRCEKLGIECHVGVEDGASKLSILKQVAEENGAAQEETLYVGDDVNDAEAIEWAGIGVTVADGHDTVKRLADIVLTRKGGEHALRELADMILTARKADISY